MSDVSQPADGPGRAERQAALAALTGKQMFFIGASPRTGTTWLQLLLDAHPDISCRGEGHFFDSLKPECAALGEKTPDNVHWFAKLRQIGVGARQRFRIAGAGGDMPLQQLDDQREIGGEALFGGVEAALGRRLEREHRRRPSRDFGVGEARPDGEHAERDHSEHAGFDERILDRLAPDQAAERNDAANRDDLQRTCNERSQCHPPTGCAFAGVAARARRA